MKKRGMNEKRYPFASWDVSWRKGLKKNILGRLTVGQRGQDSSPAGRIIEKGTFEARLKHFPDMVVLRNSRLGG